MLFCIYCRQHSCRLPWRPRGNLAIQVRLVLHYNFQDKVVESIDIVRGNQIFSAIRHQVMYEVMTLVQGKAQNWEAESSRRRKIPEILGCRRDPISSQYASWRYPWIRLDSRSPFFRTERVAPLRLTNKIHMCVLLQLYIMVHGTVF